MEEISLVVDQIPYFRGRSFPIPRSALDVVGPGLGIGPTNAMPFMGQVGMGPLGMSVAARRKNATRETTAMLKSWLHTHIKNPYPSKAEKIMLAILTKMSLTQVCN